jgi:transposase
MVNRQRTTSWRAPRMLSAAQQEELRAALAGRAPDGGKHWSCRAVADWMAAKLGRPVPVQHGWDYLQRLKHSQPALRPRHALADGASQRAHRDDARGIGRAHWEPADEWWVIRNAGRWW